MQTQFRFFYLPYLLLLAASIVIVTLTDHGDTVLWMNSIHTPFLNTFFKLWTHGGDGIFYGLVALLLLIFKRRHGLVYLAVGAAQGLIAALMKQVLFKGTPRPAKFFEGQNVLDLIDGFKVHHYNSFPSGHTMTGFAIGTFLALMTDRKELKVFLLFYSILVGASRIYLNQHFLIDTVVGSFIGVVVAAVCVKVFERYLGGRK